MIGTNSARAWYDSARRIAVIAAVFVAIMGSLLIVNHFKIIEADPRSSIKLATMKTDLKKHKRDEKLRESIRKLDRELRTEYFQRAELSRVGGYLLLGGLVVFLIAVPGAARFRKLVPVPDPDSDSLEVTRQEAAGVRRSVAVLGLTAVAGMAVLAAFSRGSLDSDLIKASKRPADSGSRIPAPPASGAIANLPFGAPPSVSGAVTPTSTTGSVGTQVPAFLPPAGVGEVVKDQPASGLKVEGGVLDEGDAPSAADIARNWPTFRGPAGSSTAASDKYSTHWNGAKGEGILWKTKIPLPGENSPVVWDNRIFLSGADENNREVYCVDAGTGNIIWKESVPPVAGKDAQKPDVMTDTGYAAPTMAADGKRAYAIFANADVVCFSFDGKKLWQKALGTPESTYGYAASLTMYKSLLIVQLDQGSSAKDGKSAILALQASPGKLVWMSKRPVPNSWTSPIVVNTGRRDEIITSASPWVMGYDPATGKELWRADCMSGDVGPSAAFAGGMVFACNAGACLAAIKAGGSGDITKSGIVWTAKSGLPDTSSPASNGEIVILAQSEGMVTCYDAKKGANLWEHPYETGFSASPVFLGSLVYLMDSEGIMHIIEASKSFKEVTTSALGEKCNASPAFVGGRIYIRGKQNLYCVGAK